MAFTTPKCLLLVSIVLLSPLVSKGQWTPSGALAQVPVIENCAITQGDVAVFRKPNGIPTVFYCQAVVNKIDETFPLAGYFYFAHEFGHAAGILNEDGADCWAARQLAAAPNGAAILKSAIGHFRARGNEWHPGYSTSSQRADNIARCAHLQSTQDGKPERKNDQSLQSSPHGACESEYGSCIANVRSIDQCVREEYPDRCIKTCMRVLGFSRTECEARRCQATASNMAGWRSRCASITREEKEECETHRDECRSK